MSQTTYQALTAPPTAPRPRPVRRGLAWLAVLVLALAAVVGSNAFSVRERLLGSALPDPVAPAMSRALGSVPSGSPERTALRSAPWWQTVTTLEGTGSTTSAPFTIGSQAIDWRVTWSCPQGRLVVRVPGEPRPLVDAACPQGVGYTDRTGSTRLEVTADGPWALEVAQRIDLPLVEPPLPVMSAPGTKVFGAGHFYKVDRVGAGTVTIYDQADGGYSVRLEDFWVSSKTSLQLRLSAAEAPQTSEEYLDARSQLLATLDATAGSMNYTAPVGVDAEGFRSVVIWSSSDNSVFAAARLEPPS